MNKPKPKFCIGEEVRLVSIMMPELNTDRTEIIKMGYRMSADGVFEWGYGLDIPSDRWAGERALRKLPPEDRAQWSDCAWQPKSNAINTQMIED